MPLPSMLKAPAGMRAWSVARAAAFGAAIGLAAAVLRMLGPFGSAAPGHGINRLTDNLFQIAVAAAGFGLLCAAAAALRNFIARYFVWDERQQISRR